MDIEAAGGQGQEPATPYTKAQAKASDAELAQLHQDLYAAVGAREQAVYELHHAAGDRRIWDARYAESRWQLTRTEAIGAAGLLANNAEAFPQQRSRAQAALAGYEQSGVREQNANRAIDEHEATHWQAHGRWPRFFVVPGGHIHRSRSCPSLRITTRIGWLPQLSGESEADAVAAHGAVLCTKCFPSAPVEWTNGAKVDPRRCPGSGQYVADANMRLYSPRGTCPQCQETVSVTRIMKARAHKRPDIT